MDYHYYIANTLYLNAATKTDGSIITTTRSGYDASSWTDIIDLSGGYDYLLGLKFDGSTIITGSSTFDVSTFINLSYISAGWYHAIGLKSDGTVIGAGSNGYSAISDTATWTDIIQVSAGHERTLGLKSDGTVVGAGRNANGELDVSGWTDIVQISAGGYHTLGLKSDGTVLAIGRSNEGQLNVSGWSDIVQVFAGDSHSIGLKSDGTLVSCGDNDYGETDVSTWSDIVQVVSTLNSTIGLKSDGTVVGVGNNVSSKISDLYLFNGIQQPQNDDIENNYIVRGFVTENGSYVDRTIRLYERLDCTLLDEITSVNGIYKFELSSGTEKQVVVLSESQENDLIYRIMPVSIDDSTNIYSAKSVIIDIADGWNSSSIIGIRSIDFYLNDVLIDVVESDFASYSTSCYSSSYSYDEKYIFITALPKTGNPYNPSSGWLSANGINTNQRIIIIFNEIKNFDSIVVNNAHNSGTIVTRGIKNTKIYISTDEITDTTYNAEISNSTLIFDGEIRQHVEENIQDDIVLELI